MAKIIWKGIRGLGILVFFCIIFWGVESFTALAQPTQPNNQANALEQNAQTYFKNNQYSEAEQVYKSIIQRYPKTDYEFRAQKDLATLYIKMGNIKSAQKTTDTLLNNFSNHPVLAKALLEIGSSYSEKGKEDEALQLHEYNVKTFPETESAMWSQMHIAMSNIRIRNDAAAQAAINKLLTDFSGNEHIAQAVHEIAGHCNWLQKHEKALELHQYVLDNWPGSEQAFWSQMGVAVSNIALNKTEAAQAAVDKLLTDFSGNKHIAQAVHEIAGHCNWLQKHEKALELHQYVLDNWPRSEQAMWSQMGVAVSNITLGKTEAAQAAIDKLLTGYPKDESMANAVRQIADEYCKQGNYDKALQFYKEALELHRKALKLYPQAQPNSKNTIWMKAGIIRGDISDTAIDEFLSKFSNHPGLGEVVLRIGEPYFQKGSSLINLDGDTEVAKTYFRKSAEIWERVIREFPDSNPDSKVIPAAYSSAAVSYALGLGEYQKGIDYFEKVLDNWPDFEENWYVNFYLGEYYEKLMNSGTIPASVALPKIEKAYKTVVEKYPDCKFAVDALFKLGQINFMQGKFPEAVKYFEILLKKEPDKICIVGSDLNWAYKEIGNTKDASRIQSEIEKNCPKQVPLREKIFTPGLTHAMEAVAQALDSVVRESTTQESLAKGVFGFFQKFEHNTGISLPSTLLPPHWENQSQFNKTLDLIEEKWLSFPVNDYYDEVGIFLLWGNITAGRFDKADTLFTKMKGNLISKNIDPYFDSNPLMEFIYKINFCREPFVTREDLSLLYASKVVLLMYGMYEHELEPLILLNGERVDRFWETVKLVIDNYKGTKGAELFSALYEFRKAELKYGSREIYS